MIKIFSVFRAMLILTMIFLLSGCSELTVIEDIKYDETQMKKIAYDSLQVQDQKTIIRSLEEYYKVIEEGENVVSLRINKDALDIDDVWVYAACEEVIINNLDEIAWINDEVKEEIASLSNHNNFVLRVEMATTNLILGSIVVYVDPIKEEVIGYGLRF